MTLIKKILVPIDFSDHSRAAFHQAEFLAGEIGASLTILHVIWEPPPYVGAEVMVKLPRGDSQTLNAYTRSVAAKRVAEFLEATEPQDKNKLQIEYAHGEASAAIVDTAQEQDIDLIIMGTHGRTGLSHALLGSIAEKVVRRAPCPVMTVRGTTG